MFFYLSFLRAPPLEASTRGPISITPQIANDLRTEFFPDPLDVYYSWSQVLPKNSISNGPPSATVPIATKPVKLTTWRPATAYKEIGVPLPDGIRRGQSWRFLLTAQDPNQPHFIHLKGDSVGVLPFAVASMPIWFAPHIPLSPTRQDEIERIFRFPSSTQETAYLTVREHTSFDLDKVTLLPIE